MYKLIYYHKDRLKIFYQCRIKNFMALKKIFIQKTMCELKITNMYKSFRLYKSECFLPPNRDTPSDSKSSNKIESTFKQTYLISLMQTWIHPLLSQSEIFIFLMHGSTANTFLPFLQWRYRYWKYTRLLFVKTHHKNVATKLLAEKHHFLVEKYLKKFSLSLLHQSAESPERSKNGFKTNWSTHSYPKFYVTSGLCSCIIIFIRSLIGPTEDAMGKQ